MGVNRSGGKAAADRTAGRRDNIRRESVKITKINKKGAFGAQFKKNKILAARQYCTYVRYCVLLKARPHVATDTQLRRNQLYLQSVAQHITIQLIASQLRVSCYVWPVLNISIAWVNKNATF